LFSKLMSLLICTDTIIDISRGCILIEHIKEFINENRGLVAGGAGVAILMALNFGGDTSNIDAVNSARKPASKMRVKKRDPKFRSLGDNKVKTAFSSGKLKKTKSKKKPKKKSNPSIGNSSPSGVGFGHSKDSGTSMNYGSHNNDSGYNQLPENSYSEPIPSSDPVYEDPETIDTEITDTGSGGTSTGGTTSVGGGGGGGGGSPVTSTCSASPGAGIYINNPYATISCTNSTEIYYCVQKGGGCCDPTNISSANVYTSDALISSLVAGSQDDGSFCLSYYAVSTSGLDSEIGYVDSYSVNDDAIDISYEVSPLRRQIKSTQSQFVLPYISDSFGIANYDFFAINTGDTAPAGGATPSDCAALADADTGFGDLSDPFIVRGPSGYYVTPTDGFDPADVIDIPLISEQPLDHGLTRGENYISAFMKFTDAANNVKYGCISTPVLVQDPSYVRALLSHDFKSAANGSGIVEFKGGVQSYGNFDYTTTAAEGKATVNNFTLESGHINITH
jgi:hypothetical protein